MTFASITFIVFFTLVLVLEGITNVRVVKEKLGKSFLYCAPHDFADCQLYILRLVGLAFLLLILFCDSDCISGWLTSPK